MEKVIVLRYGEIYLKGKNRSFFEKQLVVNIRKKLEAFACKFTFGRSRYIVSNYADTDEIKILEALKTVFGLHSFSVAHRVSADYEKILEIGKQLIPQKGSFRVNANRADKRFPLTSVALASKLGGDLLETFPNLSVDLHKSEFTLEVDVREDGTAFVYSGKISGAGGMPVGTAGKGLLMLSGGIDSPVAGYMLAKRGLRIDALHFHSYPYTSERAKQKVMDLARIMQNYCGRIRMFCLPITHLQEAIHKNCNDNYMITILRRCMMRLSERVALANDCGCLINGESLGQVASQTLESIQVTNAMVEKLPVFRPLIGMDKQEIIDIAEKIGTYATSVLPYEDCCTVFLPDSPVTKPTLAHAIEEEQKLNDLEALLDESFNNLEVIHL